MPRTGNRDVSAAEVLADQDPAGKVTTAADLPPWITDMRRQPAAVVARALGARVLFECPKCRRVTMQIDGHRWRCDADGCGRRGDAFDLVARGLCGRVYFQLTPIERHQVRHWAEQFLEDNASR